MRAVFTHNATHAVNLVLRGLLRPGDRVVTTAMEHNAVMRPLRALEREGVRLVVVRCGPDGTLCLDEARHAIAPGTRLVVAAHASNVTGTLHPVVDLAALAHRAAAPLLVDAALMAGAVPIDLAAMDIDYLAVTGHKGLLGPPGTGALLLGDRVEPTALLPLLRGGTGSRSDSEEQPEDLPDKFESGTPNGAGIAGLGAGVRIVQGRGVAAIQAHEAALAQALLEGLARTPGVTVFGPRDSARQTAVVSFTVAGRQVSEIGLRLDDDYGVLARVGLHCAPAAHRTIGTYPGGTVRLSPGPETTPEDIAATLQAIEEISGG
jgi:cysteine desulfurase family protein